MKSLCVREPHCVVFPARSRGTALGAATLATIDAQYDTAELWNSGTEWVVLNRDIT